MITQLDFYNFVCERLGELLRESKREDMTSKQVLLNKDLIKTNLKIAKSTEDIFKIRRIKFTKVNFSELEACL